MRNMPRSFRAAEPPHQQLSTVQQTEKFAVKYLQLFSKLEIVSKNLKKKKKVLVRGEKTV